MVSLRSLNVFFIPNPRLAAPPPRFGNKSFNSSGTLFANIRSPNIINIFTNRAVKVLAIKDSSEGYVIEYNWLLSLAMAIAVIVIFVTYHHQQIYLDIQIRFHKFYPKFHCLDMVIHCL